MNKPMVLVTWLDAKDGQTGWHSIEDIQKEQLAVCHSAGWLMYKDETKIIIMADYLEQDPPEYATAAMEMLDSRWAKQTPNRAEAMSAEMAGIG